MRSVGATLLFQTLSITLILLSVPLGANADPVAQRPLQKSPAIKPVADITSFADASAAIRSFGSVRDAETPANISVFASQMEAGSRRGNHAVPVPESSTLFLLGLGLIGLAQIPLRRLTKRSSGASLQADAKDLSEQTEAEKDSSLAA
jgi:hypothetical protein